MGEAGSPSLWAKVAMLGFLAGASAQVLGSPLNGAAASGDWDSAVQGF